MANSNFVVRNGLEVGPLTIDAATGTITTTGDVNITGNLGVSQIAKNDSSITIDDTGPGSNVIITIDGVAMTTVGAKGLTTSPDGTARLFRDETGELTDTVYTATANVNAFVQAAISNRRAGASASTDYIAYADTGDNTGGYIDMGIASSTFDDPAYAVTKAGDGYIFLSAPTGTGGNLVLATADGSWGDVVFAAGGFANGAEQGRFKTNDGLYISGNLVADGGTIYQGPLAKSFEASADITDPAAIFTGNIDSFVQIGLHNRNTGPSASADFIAYADTGDNVSGYIDMGVASTTFTDPEFAVTKAGDGYIFLSAPKYANTTPTGGNLVLATADGAYGDIVFAAGGFATGAEQARFILDDGLSVTGNLISQMGAIYQGPGAKNLITSANATATLGTTANSSVTTITVDSTTGFLVHGALYIDSELLYYTSKTGTQFTGITRGTSGTTAASHTSGALVYQPNAGITDASTVLVGNSDSFVQVALKNTNSGSSASTDMICYASNGDNDSGWMDMGITSETFAASEFGITGADDGYIFMSAPAGTTGDGAMVIATSENGVTNDIIFATNGFVAGNERMRIVGTDRLGRSAGVEVNIATTATSTTTGALRVNGGVGLLGNLYVGGNFNLQGNITIGGTGSTTSTSTLVIENPISFLANANNGDSQDIGIVGQYTNGGTKYAGVLRDSVTKSFRFFDGLATKPSTTAAFASSTAGNVYAGQLMLANTTVSSSTSTGALVVGGGAGIGGKLYVGGEMTITGSIVPTANLTYNLGAPSSWFNTFYGVSTQAKYADLAENYQADSNYAPGTVLEFGGAEEVTIATEMTKRVAGVVSHNPAHLMNGGLQGVNVVPLALQGRVPCKVTGPVQKGDLMVSAGFGYAKANNDAQLGQVIGKALADFSGAKGQIEIVVGRL